MSYSIGFDIFAKDRASKEFDQVGDAASRTGGKISKFGVMAAAGAVVAGAAILKVGIQTVSSASDQGEALNKSSVIFGANAKAIEQWADSAYKSTGLSKTAALDAASGFGDMFSQLGFTGAKATDMSKAVVQMSADLGSFNNLPTADVADMMSGAFRGEYDSLQRLIPNINAARVEQEAQRLGLVKNTVDVRKLSMARETQSLAERKYASAVKDHGKNSDEARRAALTLSKAQDAVAKAAAGAKGDISAQAKAQAVLSIVQGDGSRAAGDFARTSGGLANQQKILQAAFENTKAKVGQALLPVLTKLGGWFISTGLPAIQRFGGWISGTLWPALQKGYQTIMPGLQSALKIVTGGVEGSGISWKKVSDIVVGKVIPFLALLVRSYLPVLATNLRAGIEVVKALWMAFETWRGIMDKVFSFILSGFSMVTRIWAGVLDALGHIPGFGWAKDAAAKMRGAADAADRIRDRINLIPKTKDVTIRVSSKAMTGKIKVNGQQVNIGAYASGGHNIPPGWKWVGEDGPELMWTPGGESVIPNRESTQMAGGYGRGGSRGADGGGDSFVVMVPPGTTQQQAMDLLREFKRIKRLGIDVGLA